MQVEPGTAAGILRLVFRVLTLPVFLVAVFLGGGLTAPWIWWGVQEAARLMPVPWIQGLADQPFTRYVHRCVLVLALIGIWPLARALGFRNLSELGLHDPGRAGRRWARGFAVGAAMFALTLAVEVGFGWRIGRAGLTADRVAGFIGTAAVSAVAVGALEEMLFRGLLCRGLAGTLGWGSAILASSVVYAWTHFLGKGLRPETVTWTTGAEVALDMVLGSLGREALLPGLPTLVLAGVLLGCLLRRTGSLYASMGLHMGWVFWIKMRGALTVRVSEPGISMGESRISAGWPGLVAVFLAVIVFLVWVIRNPAPESAEAEAEADGSASASASANADGGGGRDRDPAGT